MCLTLRSYNKTWMFSMIMSQSLVIRTCSIWSILMISSHFSAIRVDIFQEVFAFFITFQTHYSLLHFTNLTILSDLYKCQSSVLYKSRSSLSDIYKWQSSLLCSVLNCSFTSAFLSPNIFDSTFFWNLHWSIYIVY